MFPSLPTAASTSLVVSSNPVKVAEFSYELITGCIMDVIPLIIRETNNPNDQDASRALLSIFMNRLHQSKDGYDRAVTQGVLQGCSGLSLMLGYDNPWGVLLRKQCETAPLSISGLYDLVLAIVTDVPVAKCLCIDARETADFKRNALDKCYHIVPTYMKPLVLSMIENADINGDQQAVCAAMVDYASSNVKEAMTPWFSRQYEATESLASSFDYLLRSFDVDAGRCMDFDGNPFAVVLIPQPYDYFSTCTQTAVCKLKCNTEITAFENEVLRYTESSLPRVTKTSVASRFFNELDEDSFMPMKIITLVELSECVPICGGGTGDRNTCIAIAGIPANSTITVKKYCIPRNVGDSVREAPSEEWNIW